MMQDKKCTLCKLVQPIKDFYFINISRSNSRRNYCKKCSNGRLYKWRLLNKDKVKVHAHRCYMKNLEHYQKVKKRYWNKQKRNKPWLRSYYNARQRCLDPHGKYYHNYGGKGVKMLLTRSDSEYLWYRDKGWLLRVPSIDRIDSNGNYTLANCRFIEHGENSSRRRKIPPDIIKMIRKEYETTDNTQREIATRFNISHGHVGRILIRKVYSDII